MSPPSNHEYLRSVTIGACKPHNSVVRLVQYDPSWPLHFAQHAERIRRALTEKVVLLEHVGSTSVPGLSAKRVIDMVLVVADSTDEQSYVPPLKSEGFVLRIREPEWFEHRMLIAPRIPGHVHVFSLGCSEIDRMLAFRDLLRTNDADRDLYERAKYELAQRTWRYVDDYADAKSEVIRDILHRAGAENV